jgi:hypothetical protein
LEGVVSYDGRTSCVSNPTRSVDNLNNNNNNNNNDNFIFTALSN